MKDIYKAGDKISLEFVVKETDVAAFEGNTVHPVYSTFALGRDAEWTCRQFVINMKEDGEEGIGTMLTIQHHSPALLGQTVVIEGCLKSIERNEIICEYMAKVNDRLIASGETGQKILKKERIESIFSQL
ncbi:MAG: hypothetical protein HYZ42_07295 [Bacteroidetes bacterium]|nr:hypothetical protein [Bacteroidota bacterium]